MVFPWLSPILAHGMLSVVVTIHLEVDNYESKFHILSHLKNKTPELTPFLTPELTPHLTPELTPNYVKMQLLRRQPA